jgi:hypothetical protein
MAAKIPAGPYSTPHPSLVGEVTLAHIENLTEAIATIGTMLDDLTP